MSQDIVSRMTQGLSPAEWQRLLTNFPLENPKVTDSMEQIQRKAGQQDVINWMKSNFK